MNLRFSWEATLKARTGVEWVREMAAFLVNEARTRTQGVVVAHPLLTREHVTGSLFWVGDPDTLRAMQTIPAPPGMNPPTWSRFQTLPCVPNFQGAVGFPDPGLRPVGVIYVHPESYDFTSRELHGRWETYGRMEYTLAVDWSKLRYLHVSDIPVSADAEII
jgi:hypothetical protein